MEAAAGPVRVATVSEFDRVSPFIGVLILGKSSHSKMVDRVCDDRRSGKTIQDCRHATHAITCLLMIIFSTVIEIFMT